MFLTVVKLLRYYINLQAKCVFADNFVHIPFFYMPIFYFIREFAADDGDLVDHASRATVIWRENIFVDTTRQVRFEINSFLGDICIDTYWFHDQACIFVPVQTWNFAMNPPHWRVLYLLNDT